MNEQVKNQTTQVAPGIDEAPMAVYPLNSSAKLDQEPNPFEKSFSGATIEDKKLILPPVASITSPAPVGNNNGVIGGGILPKEVTNQFTWETLRTGPLSPSMLQGPINSEEYYSSTTTLNVPTSTRSSFSNTYPVKIEPQPQTTKSTRSRQSSTTSVNNRKRSNSHIEDDMSLDSHEDEETTKTKKKNNKSNNANDTKDDEKRKNFLERNRIAALKCRQRKKQWLNNLQAKVEFLTSDNERLQIQSESLKEEIVNLKTLLLAHKDCPVAQANGFNTNSIQKGIPSISSSDILRQNMGFQPQPQQPQPYSRNNSISSTSNNPSYQRTSMPSMVAGGGGGSSGIIRF